MIEFEIGGKVRKFSFGLEVLGWIQAEAGIDLTNLKEGTSDTSLYFILIKPLILLGNKREVEKEGKRIDYTYDDVEQWLLEKGVYHEDIIGLWNKFNETTASYLPKQKPTKSAKKK